MSSKDNLALDQEQGVQRWDRARWISVFSSHNPTIREITECLGLGLSASSSTTNRGIPKFDNPDYRKLSSEVTKLSKELPKERDALLDFAADPKSLDAELEELLTTYGPAIWGRDADRTCLLTADATKKTYTRDLFYDVPEDKEILKIHLHRWIIIKACYYIRNMKLKRPSAAGDYETLADIDADGAASPNKSQLSPHETIGSATPPDLPNGSAAISADFKSFNSKKRKTSAYMSLSDGEDPSSTPSKRPYSSHTMPLLSRKSPRKSLKSLAAASPGSSENIPPQGNYLSPSVASAPTPEVGRTQLSPLSNNELNGVSRHASPAPGGFTAVNSTGSFTAVNTASAIPESVREPPREPVAHDARNYASPYDSSPYGAPAAQNASEPRAPSTLNGASVASHSFQAVNSPPVTNGVPSRNSPVVPHAHHAHIAPQPQQPPPAQIVAQVSVHHQPNSRSNTPGTQSHARSHIAHAPPSRTNTPLAPVANLQPTPAPNVQTAHAYNMHIVPTQTSHPAHAVPLANHHHAPQPVLKSHPGEVAHAPPKAYAPADLSFLQCEVLGLLMQYLFPKHGSPPDEALLFHKLETLWYHGASAFNAQLHPHFDLYNKILTSWILERRKISALRHGLAYSPGIPAAEMVDRLLAMNDLRVMRLKWKNMSTVEGVSPEDLLCRTLAVVTNTEGTEYLFKDGLERLNESLFEFLRSEDLKIMMVRR